MRRSALLPAITMLALLACEEAPTDPAETTFPAPELARIRGGEPGAGLDGWPARRADAVAAAPLASYAAAGAEAESAELWVANVQDDDVSVLRTPGLEPRARHATEASSPLAVAFSRDASLAFVVVSGGELVVMDPETGAVVNRIALSGPGDRLVYRRPGTDLLYVSRCSDGPDVIDVVDAITQSLVGTIPLPSSGWAMAFSPDGRFAYVTDCPWQVPGIHVIDLDAGAAVDFIETVDGTNGVAVSPDGSRVAVTGGRYVSIVDVESGAETRLDCADFGAPCPLRSWTQGVAFVSDTRLLVVDGARTLLDIDVSDPGNPTLVSTTDVPAGVPWTLRLAGDRAYVLSYGWPSEVTAYDIGGTTPVLAARQTAGDFAYEMTLRTAEAVDPAALLEDLAAEVAALALPDGAPQLMAVLDRAAASLDAGRPAVAVRQLDAFIRMVEGLSHGRLDDGTAGRLTALARGVIAAIESGG